MPKFKVGDIITGTESGRYGVTTVDATMEVLETKGNSIKVKIIEHKKKGYIGHSYNVLSAHFKKIEDNKIKKTMTNKPVYWECKDNGHSKFWASHIIKRDNMFILVRKWGRIGNKPQTMDQEFTTYSEAENTLDDLIREKEGKGYKFVF